MRGTYNRDNIECCLCVVKSYFFSWAIYFLKWVKWPKSIYLFFTQPQRPYYAIAGGGGLPGPLLRLHSLPPSAPTWMPSCPPTTATSDLMPSTLLPLPLPHCHHRYWQQQVVTTTSRDNSKERGGGVARWGGPTTHLLRWAVGIVTISRGGQ